MTNGNPRKKSKRFSPTVLGFLRFRARTGNRLEKSSWKKWGPILRQLEALRVQRYNLPWGEIDPEDLGCDLIPALYAKCKSKKGGKPQTNTLRGRYDACKAFFDFLVVIGELESNPCEWQRRPSSKANLQPFLEPSEDELLARAPKEEHEVAVYALARGAGLREEEICECEDTWIDFENNVLIVPRGKTRNAERRIPLSPTTGLLLLQYRAWRDEHVLVSSPYFVRTRSGSISPAYVWKLTKRMGVRAAVRLVTDDGGQTTTEITPHSLRRTLATDLANRGMSTVVISYILGHSTKRVTEESYALAQRESIARQFMLVAGEGPFTLAGGVRELGATLSQAELLAPANPEAALAELRRLQAAAAHFERALLQAAPELAGSGVT